MAYDTFGSGEYIELLDQEFDDSVTGLNSILDHVLYKRKINIEYNNDVTAGLLGASHMSKLDLGNEPNVVESESNNREQSQQEGTKSIRNHTD